MVDLAVSTGTKQGRGRYSKLGKIFWTFFAITALLFAGVSAPSHAASCTKANSIKVISGSKFVCKKVGGKLQWVKQGSNAVVNNQQSAPSPAPTATIKEWTKCPGVGKVSGSGDDGFVCIKVGGKPQWVKNSTLDTPTPKKPCRSEGRIGNWRDEVLLCTSGSSGNTWQIPVFENETKEYVVSARNQCHSNLTTAILETQEAGEWTFLDYAYFVRNAACQSGFSGVEARVDLQPGAIVRLRVFTSQWSWTTDPIAVGSASQVNTTSSTPVQLTPKSAQVTMQDVSGQHFLVLEFAGYSELGNQSIFTFRPSANSSRFFFTNSANFRTSRGITAITSQPFAGRAISADGTFEIRVQRDAIQWNLTEFEFEITGSYFTSFTKRVKVNFTWG